MGALLRYWNRLPVLIRAIAGGYLLVAFGSSLTVLPVLGNIKFHPGVPWALPAVMLVCWGYWKYFSGLGWPAETRDARRRMSRTDMPATKLGPRLGAMLIAGLVFILGYRLLMPSLFDMPPQTLPIDLAEFPLPTAVGFIVSVALGAAVVEELALRGYAQRLMEDRYGLVPAIALVSLLFWLVHLNHATMTIRHVPFYIFTSTIAGFTACLSRSLAPVIALHFAADAVLLPVYTFRPAVTETLLAAKPIWEAGATSAFYVDGSVCLLAGVTTGYLMWRLARDHRMSLWKDKTGNNQAGSD